MKQLAAWTLALALLLGAQHRAVLIGCYFINKNYIARTFCENQDKPALQCDGKCHLAKYLQPETTPAPAEQVPPPPSFKDTGELPLFCAVHPPAIPVRPGRQCASCLPPVDEPLSHSFTSDIFRPPASCLS